MRKAGLQLIYFYLSALFSFYVSPLHKNLFKRDTNNQCFLEQLVLLVSENSHLYDLKNKNNNLKQNTWMEIANKLDCTVEMVQTKSISVRDRYARDKNRTAPSGSGLFNKLKEWPLSKLLCFLDQPNRTAVATISSIDNYSNKEWGEILNREETDLEVQLF
ncbi:hypothetical protein FQA39_LY13709 [Lamprigera yunnana]|nr:hypothetical protein FQA39_LY13709 [Lamprigera yunnana]